MIQNWPHGWRSSSSAVPPPSWWQTASYLLKLVLYHWMTEPQAHQYTRSIYEFFGKRNPLPQLTSDQETHGNRSANYEQRLSNGQAALGLRQLRRLETNVAHRRETGMAYSERLSEQGFPVPRPPARAEPAFVCYPVWVHDPAMTRRVVACYATIGTWFSSVLEEAISPAGGDYEMGPFLRAEVAARHLIDLPTNPRVNEQDIEIIVSAVVRAETMVRK